MCGLRLARQITAEHGAPIQPMFVAQVPSEGSHQYQAHGAASLASFASHEMVLYRGGPRNTDRQKSGVHAKTSADLRKGSYGSKFSYTPE